MVSYTLENFNKEAKKFAEKQEMNAGQANIVALHGDLGAGKTTFTQQVAKTLGVTETVVSPTFLIQKKYPLEGQVFANLIHIDAYRLESTDQLEVLDWADLICDPSNLIFIEWPEHVEGLLAPNTKHIYFEYIDSDTRAITYGEKS